MTTELAALPLPPGRFGPPYFGESLALLRNPFAFVEDRHRRYGPVFKSRILGPKVAFLTGLDGAAAFYDDDAISREHAHPAPLLDLFGGRNMELLDGERHRRLKTVTLASVDADALAHYLPDLQRLFERRLAEWGEAGEVEAGVELRTLAIEAICLNFLGLEPGPVTAAITRDYGQLLDGLVSPPAPLPGTPYRRAQKARDRLLATIRGVIAERRAAPASGNDGLSRLLAARTADGWGCSDEEAALEVHHVVLAGFIVCGLLAEVVRRLPESPDVARRCRAEVAEHASPHAGPLTIDALRRMTTATTVVMEAKRAVPLVPLAFGRARRDLTFAGCRIPAGWRVYLSLRVSNLDPAVFADPHRFEPDRFGPARAEHLSHPLAFIPQGTGPPLGHLCLGWDYSSIVVLAFLAVLVGRYQWDVPAQDFTLRFDTLPPAHRDGLKVCLRPRESAGPPN
jgi:cytochrome P450